MADQVREYDRQYRGTYIGVQHKGKTFPFLVDSVQRNNDGSAGFFGNMLTSGGFSEGKTLGVDDVILTFPKMGMFNIKNQAVFLARNSQRQWKRGLRGSLYNIHNPVNNERSICGLSPIGKENKTLLREIFNPNYPPITTAVELLRSGDRLAVAIDHDLFVCAKSWSTTPVLGYKRWIVGTIDEELSVKLFEEAKPFKEVIESALDRLKGEMV